jgi:hypothetical protein
VTLTSAIIAETYPQGQLTLNAIIFCGAPFGKRFLGIIQGTKQFGINERKLDED